MMKRCGLILILGAALLVVSCATHRPFSQTHTDIQQKFIQVKKVTILPPRVSAYELPAVGDAEPKPDRVPVIQKLILTAIEKELAVHGIKVKYITPSSLTGGQQANLKETLALLDLTTLNNQNRFMGPGYTRLHEFDDSLGTEVNLLDPETDALMQVSILEILPTGTQQAVEVGKSVVLNTIAFALCIPMVLSGVPLCIGYDAKWGEVLVEVSMIDAKTGVILFSNMDAIRGGGGWEDPEESPNLAKALVERVFKSFHNPAVQEK